MCFQGWGNHGGRERCASPQILTLSQPGGGGADYAQHISSPPLDCQTFRHLWYIVRRTYLQLSYYILMSYTMLLMKSRQVAIAISRQLPAT